MQKFIAILPVLLLMFTACTEEAKSTDKVTDSARDEELAASKPMNFVSHRVVDNAKWWWALAVGDVTNDGLQDVVYIDNNANGGYLGFRTGAKDGKLWAKTVVAEMPPGGGTFAAGDLEIGDMDGDGDQDILAVKHTGEWDDAEANAEIFYYENPSWTPHLIGQTKGAVKDLSIGDFDDDGRNDLAVLTFEEHNLRIHQQQEDGSFKMVQDITRDGLHEGMDLGDIDGDGDLDIAANGFVFMNPGGDLTGEWAIEVIDPKWNTQTGDWSANATKVFVTDILGNGMLAIFISHSERDGYPLAYYLRKRDGTYVEGIVLDSLPAAHTLQVFDMDMDGDLDIVTGINSARAVDLDPKVDHFEVLVLTNDGNEKWGRKVIEIDGIYNGKVADFEGDGDMDIFRYPNHAAKDLFFMENQLR